MFIKIASTTGTNPRDKRIKYHIEQQLMDTTEYSTPSKVSHIHRISVPHGRCPVPSRMPDVTPPSYQTTLPTLRERLGLPDQTTSI